MEGFIKKRIHDDDDVNADADHYNDNDDDDDESPSSPMMVEPRKKTCLLADHDVMGQKKYTHQQQEKMMHPAVGVSVVARELQNKMWMDFVLYRRSRCHGSSSVVVLDMITATGSIVDFVYLLKFLFETNRVETLALDLMQEFWTLFPEAAEKQLYLFQQHSCWQQLLLLMERANSSKASNRNKVGTNISHAALELLKDQWNADVLALKTHNGRGVSELVMWLPLEPRKHRRDKRLNFIKIFTRMVYPNKKQPSKVKLEAYRHQVRALRDAIHEQRRRQLLPSLPTNTNNNIFADDHHQDEIMVHVVSRDPLSGDETIRHQQEEPPSQKNIIMVPQRTGQLLAPPDSFEGVSLYTTLLCFAPNHNTGFHHEPIIPGLRLPTEGRVDHYLFQKRAFRQASEMFLQKPVRLFDPTSTEKVLYIHQGEVGYAIPSQCNIIMTDRATTCHILSLQSTVSSTSSSTTLTSLAHIDSDIYSECLETMIDTHVRHHKKQQSNNDVNPQAEERIQLVVDMVGGFDDDRGSSANISMWLMVMLAYFAEAYRDVLVMTIRTCAISYMNDDGTKSPRGRGMGIDLRTGQVFLAKATDVSSMAPGMQLRSARIWSGGGGGKLSVVHNAATKSSQEEQLLVIHPFSFGSFDRMHSYLRMPNEKMIQRTSTSPDVEEADFCESVRNTLRFMKSVDCREVFGMNLDCPVRFQRIGASNVWKRC